MPTVTAVIPTYNRAALLVEAMESALGQTRPPDEIIVMDDGSTDQTPSIMPRYAGRVHYVRQANAGPAAARNHAFRIATGDFIALLDSDDLWVTDHLHRQLQALAQHPDLDLIFGIEAKFSAEGPSSEGAIYSPAARQLLDSVACVIPEPLGLLLQENCIPTSSVLFRRRCLEGVGYIDESLQQAEDYDFWLRFAAHGCRFGFIKAVLCHRRQHEGNLVRQWVNRTVATAEVLSRHGEHSPAHRDLIRARLQELYYDLGSHLLYRRDFGRALHYLRLTRPTGWRRSVWAGKLAVARLLSR